MVDLNLKESPHFVQAVYTPLLLDRTVLEPQLVSIDLCNLLRELRCHLFFTHFSRLNGYGFHFDLVQLCLLSHHFDHIFNHHSRFLILGSKEQVCLITLFWDSSLVCLCLDTRILDSGRLTNRVLAVEVEFDLRPGLLDLIIIVDGCVLCSHLRATILLDAMRLIINHTRWLRAQLGSFCRHSQFSLSQLEHFILQLG